MSEFREILFAVSEVIREGAVTYKDR